MKKEIAIINLFVIIISIAIVIYIFKTWDVTWFVISYRISIIVAFITVDGVVISMINSWSSEPPKLKVLDVDNDYIGVILRVKNIGGAGPIAVYTQDKDGEKISYTNGRNSKKISGPVDLPYGAKWYRDLTHPQLHFFISTCSTLR